MGARTDLGYGLRSSPVRDIRQFAVHVFRVNFRAWRKALCCRTCHRKSEGRTVVVKPRTAELVLVTSDGRPVGSLPAVPVATPWWQDIESVVRAARDFHGIDVTILRLLDAELDHPHGGRVTYLAEVSEAVRAQPWTGVLDDQPRRHSFARPGGPAADLAWARARLAERGLRPTTRRRRCAHGIFRACGACRSKARLYG